MENNYIVICYSTNLWLIQYYSSLIYKGIILYGVGLVLAFLTRNAKSDVLHDYHYNTAIIAVTYAFGAFYIFPQVLLIDYPTLLEFYEEFNTFSYSILFLGLTFIPKVGMHIKYMTEVSLYIQMIALHKDPLEKALTLEVDDKPTITTKNSSDVQTTKI